MQKIGIEEFLSMAVHNPVLDVRSPGEYAHAHIPGAHNLPLFTDEERKIVGTAYKQQDRQQAIKIGLDYFGVKMRKMVEDVEAIIKNHPRDQQNCVLVHCWRGGMRSAGVAWLLDLYGFKVYSLNGGYKAFRTWVLKQFTFDYKFSVLSGYTGSGKTLVLRQLASLHHPVIDLEGIAMHNGSAFGGLGKEKQPTQEMFENILGIKLRNIVKEAGEHTPIWLEDESQRIGLINLPNALWKTMRQSTIYFLDIPFEERLSYITDAYGQFKKEELVNAIIRIQKRLGNQNAKNAINYLLEDNYKESFRILLSYYDKCYNKGVAERKITEEALSVIPCDNVDPVMNCKRLSDKKQQINGNIRSGN